MMVVVVVVVVVVTVVATVVVVVMMLLLGLRRSPARAEPAVQRTTRGRSRRHGGQPPGTRERCDERTLWCCLFHGFGMRLIDVLLS